LAHLPPIIARQLTLKTTFSAKWPPHPRAEGGQVEPVLGGVRAVRLEVRKLEHTPQHPLVLQSQNAFPFKAASISSTARL
jgi:hypothetical protein